MQTDQGKHREDCVDTKMVNESEIKKKKYEQKRQKQLEEK
jgi:hypothetical protein